MIAPLLLAAALHAPPMELPAPLPDVQVVDQDGRSHRFYSDLIAGKLVVINAVYTSCTNVCPMMQRSFADLQDVLGDRLGKDVFLISISRDPDRDTPTRMKEYARRFHAKPGWMFVTGQHDAIDRLLRALTGDRASPGGHSTVAWIGNGANGTWLRTYGADEPSRTIELLNELTGPASTRAARQ
ncbi:MAG TPA: SCO family protein [Thermoanaerobaculia bacterium]|jgi:protein SCO1/2